MLMTVAVLKCKLKEYFQVNSSDNVENVPTLES